MNGPNYYLQIGEVIKELRLKHKMTKTQLADGICSISYITRIENGERCPTSVILRQITNKLGITPEHLFRAIESPSALDVKELLNQLFIYIERSNYKGIYDLIKIEEKRLEIKSIHDLQIVKGLKCASHTMLTKKYQLGIIELKNIIELTYTEGSNPTDMEFAFMYTIGFFLLLNNQSQEAYFHLKKLEKYIAKINFLHIHAIIPKYYLHLITACIDTSNFEDSFSYLDFSINYCKKHNTYAVLPELYFLKAELYYRSKKEKEFKIWYDKALKLHELTKYSDDEYFNTFVENRLNKLKN